MVHFRDKEVFITGENHNMQKIFESWRHYISDDNNTEEPEKPLTPKESLKAVLIENRELLKAKCPLILVFLWNVLKKDIVNEDEWSNIMVWLDSTLESENPRALYNKTLKNVIELKVNPKLHEMLTWPINSLMILIRDTVKSALTHSEKSKVEFDPNRVTVLNAPRLKDEGNALHIVFKLTYSLDEYLWQGSPKATDIRNALNEEFGKVRTFIVATQKSSDPELHACSMMLDIVV